MSMPTGADNSQSLERCDTCGEPCQGGVRHYFDDAKHDRIGCEDQHACLAAYTRLSNVERREIQAYRVMRWRR